MQISYSTNKNSEFLSFTLFFRFLYFAHKKTVLKYVLRKGGQKSLFFDLIPCLRTLLLLEILYLDVIAECAVTMLAHNYLATVNEISSNPFLYQMAECDNHVVLKIMSFPHYYYIRHFRELCV